MKNKVSFLNIATIAFVFLFLNHSACQAQTDSLAVDTTLYKYRYNKIIDYTYEPQTFVGYSFDLLHQEAKKHLGTPYKAQGKLPGGFDCSGFAFYLHKIFGIYLPYYSSQMSDIGNSVSVNEARKGDLILFKGSDLNSIVAGHVGIIVSNPNEPIKFIHSSSSKGIRYDFLKGNAYFEPRFLAVRRIVD